jgi:hypothetical protein
MNAEEIAQWVINNRYPKSENEKVDDFTMYHSVLDLIQANARIQIEKDRERVKEAYYNEETEGFFKDIIKNTPIILD